MSAHTPGPWTAGKRRHEGSVVEDDRQRVVATVWSHGVWVDEEQRMPDEANARLIAAAPDLLAACIEADDELADAGFRPNAPTRKALRDAIAKARGTP